MIISDKVGFFFLKENPEILLLIFLTMKTYVVASHKNCLNETALMRSQNICFLNETVLLGITTDDLIWFPIRGQNMFHTE